MSDHGWSPEAREAVARAIYEAWRDVCAIREDTCEWESTDKTEQNINRIEADAALAAIARAEGQS